MESDPLLGQRIDSYLIDEKIGQGGMAAVYRARDVGLDRDVVLKVLPPHLAALPALRQRFQREARATARLHHLNIVPIFATTTAEPDARLCELPPGAAVFAGDNLRLWPAPDVTAVTASGALEPNTPLRVVSGPAWGRVLRDDDISGWWWRVETERGDRAGWVWQARLQECAQQ